MERITVYHIHTVEEPKTSTANVIILILVIIIAMGIGSLLTTTYLHRQESRATEAFKDKD